MSELVLQTAPVLEPIQVSTVRDHLRVDITDDDVLLENLITAAREEFENQTHRTLYTTTWQLILDAWPGTYYIELPRPPLASVTSVVYKDSAGNNNTFSTASYIVDTSKWPGRIVLDNNASWPSAELYETSAITITYVAGHSNTALIPQRYKQAIMLLVGHWYENRENMLITGAVPQSIPMAFESIVWSARYERR